MVFRLLRCILAFQRASAPSAEEMERRHEHAFMSVGFNVFLARLQICPELSKADQCARSGTRSVWFLLGFDPDFLPLCHEGCKKKENRKQQKKGIPLAQPSALHSVANCNCRRPTHCRKNKSMAYERYLQKNVLGVFLQKKSREVKTS